MLYLNIRNEITFIHFNNSFVKLKYVLTGLEEGCIKGHKNKISCSTFETNDVLY